MQQGFLLPEDKMYNLENRPFDIVKSIGNKEINYERAGGILNAATGFHGTYDYSLNPYKGCFFGCSYCYAVKFSKSPGKSEDDWAAESVSRKMRLTCL